MKTGNPHEDTTPDPNPSELPLKLVNLRKDINVYSVLFNLNGQSKATCEVCTCNVSRRSKGNV